MAYSLERIIKGLKEFGKTSQFQSLANSFRNRGQHNFPTIVTLRVALCSQQGTEAGTGHVLQLAHIDNKLVFAAIIGTFQCLRKLWSSGTIHPPFDRNHVAMLELLNRDVHRTPPSESTVLMNKIIS